MPYEHTERIEDHVVDVHDPQSEDALNGFYRRRQHQSDKLGLKPCHLLTLPHS
jgi:hypothetical protein